MIEREYLKLNTSIQTGSNANQLNTDEQGNVEAKIELRLPDNIFDNNAFSRKIESVDMLTTKFRLSMENTPIAEFPLDIERSTERDPVTTCQLSVYPFCLLDNGVIKPDIASGNLSGISFPHYKSHKINYEITFTTLANVEYSFTVSTNPEVKELDYQPNYPFYEVLKGNGIFKQMKHIFNMCPQSNHEDFNVDGSKLSLRNMGTIVQMLQDSLENAISYASISSEITATIDLNEVEPPSGIYDSFFRGNYVVSTFTYTQPAANIQDTSLRNCVKPTVELGSDSISISYDSVPFTGNVPFVWNPRYIETWDKPVQFTENTTLGSEWMPPPAKRICQYGVKSSEDGYNFTLPDQSKTAVMNIIANRATRDTLSFLPWIEVDRSLLPTYTPLMHDSFSYSTTTTPKHTYDAVPVLGNNSTTGTIVIAQGMIPFTTSTHLSDFDDQEKISSIMSGFTSSLHYSSSTKFYLYMYAEPLKDPLQPDGAGGYVPDPSKETCYRGVYAYLPAEAPSIVKHGYVEYNVEHTEGVKTDETINTYTSPSIEFPSLNATSSVTPATWDSSMRPSTLSPELSESGETTISSQTYYVWYDKNTSVSPVSFSGSPMEIHGDDPIEAFSDIRKYVAIQGNHLVRLNGNNFPALTIASASNAATYKASTTIKYNGEDCPAAIKMLPLKFTTRWDNVEESSIKTLVSSENIRSLTLKTFEEDYDTYSISFSNVNTPGIDTGMEYMYQPNFTTNDDEKFYIIDGTTAEVEIGSPSPIYGAPESSTTTTTTVDVYKKITSSGYSQGRKQLSESWNSWIYYTPISYQPLTRTDNMSNLSGIVAPSLRPMTYNQYAFNGYRRSPTVTSYTYGDGDYKATFSYPDNDDNQWIFLTFKHATNAVTLDQLFRYDFKSVVNQGMRAMHWDIGGTPSLTPYSDLLNTSYYDVPFITNDASNKADLIKSVDFSVYNDTSRTDEIVEVPHGATPPEGSITRIGGVRPLYNERNPIITDLTPVGYAKFVIKHGATNVTKEFFAFDSDFLYVASTSYFDSTSAFRFMPKDSLNNTGCQLTVSTGQDSSHYYYYILAVPIVTAYICPVENSPLHLIRATFRPEDNNVSYLSKDTTITYELVESNVERSTTVTTPTEYLSNVPLSFTWRNIPMVVLSPISSIVMTLQGMECTQEIQPINVVDTTNRSSAITSTVPIIENYYSLAQSLRDLHDELVVTRESFDDGAKYSLTPRSGQERTIKLAAKYIGKDGKLHQIYIPPNGVFSVQLTFALSYFSA